MTVHFAVAGMPLTANLLVSEDIHEFMFGYDWLEALGIHWFFDHNSSYYMEKIFCCIFVRHARMSAE